ncbi:MAG: hypothetical protein K6D97_00645 [Clostridia bacterium]|nr:hypothetical protein [Clostridia bacterium]
MVKCKVRNVREIRRSKRFRRTTIVRRFSNFVFLYLVLFTIHFSMITMSKYTATSIGSGSTSVAKWEVSADNTISSKNISLVAGNTTQDYKVKVTSTSEVANTYSIVITDIPNDVKVSLDGVESTPEGNLITFTNAGSFLANDINKIHEHTLKFDAPLESNAINNAQLNLDIIFVQNEI